MAPRANVFRRDSIGNLAPQRGKRLLTRLSSELDLLGDGERIVNFDTKVAHGAFQLRMAEQQLNCAEIASLLIKLLHLGSAHGMCSVRGGIEPNLLHPAIDDSGILASGQVRAVAMAARKKETAV
jgi:hypothetical protein